jgi:hypothetical protein
MKIVETLPHIQAHPEMYLPDGATTVDLAARIVSDVLILTEQLISVQHTADWWIIAGKEDWIARCSDRPIENYFRSIVPFPEAGVNSMHGEVLLTAFADDVVTATPGRMIAIKGVIAENDMLWTLINALPKWERIVAFRARTKTMVGTDDPLPNGQFISLQTS